MTLPRPACSLSFFTMLTAFSTVSTGRLPAAERVRDLVAEAHERFKSVDEGKNADYIPALAKVPGELFGVCVIGTSGVAYEAGDTLYEFSIQSVSKPFVFALICQAIGEEKAREKLGVNSTGLPFNSVLAIERTNDGTTNPMVNAGAIAATSLAPGTTAEAKWHFVREGLSRFAGRDLTLNSEVYESEAALPRGDGDHTAADPALAGQPGFIEPVAGIFIEAGGNHYGEDVLAMEGINDPILSERVDSPVGQRGSHRSQILRGYVQRALPGVDVGCLERVEVDPVIA